MRIAVINEVSARQKNSDIIKALEGRGHEVLNLGMTGNSELPELTYIHTGLMTAMLLNSESVDFVVGGCGTGQGYLNAAMQFPGVFCGLITSPLDAWLFTQINGGNCISLPLNQGYGWAADVNLRFVFDRIFSVESGCGYPETRKESQQKSRQTLSRISQIAHRPFFEILDDMPQEIVKAVAGFPGFISVLDKKTQTLLQKYIED
ncbi:RpiB/LacA/LacB family sugar-phosphate isomerase [Lacrimispora sp.]|uniref:RpiB/LacA/LacB family sugar-phosphate isomerase n=1 Tax=Lacrimispora sp. TaxID=2719234 RepID=UPI00346156CC